MGFVTWGFLGCVGSGEVGNLVGGGWGGGMYFEDFSLVWVYEWVRE